MHQLDEEAIFHTARLIENLEARRQYLDQICAGDQPLRARVEALLNVNDQDQRFLKSAPRPEPTVDFQGDGAAPGQQIGRYKLREKLGEGGFGVVYVAEQERPVRRKVALKIIKPGMDTKDVIARFEAERQALALMDHPNVAKVLDAGATDSGRPYFVMELVHGVPITEFCDKNKLPMRERLHLFADVCRAVQHAHQKGIIHRDLKPSNVMVTLHDGKPVPKVIDFGVSKALSQQLTEKSIYTAYGQMIGTPTYMSPEQAEMSGLGIDTRSDIYSLGVLLYELLTGKTPLDAQRLRAGGYAEVVRMIREEEPQRPSLKISTLGDEATSIAQQRHTDINQLRRALRGELDWIVMKCLEKDRSRRYETANGLVRDIERYLQDEPVEARPPSTAYWLQKLARKHRVLLGTATAFAAVLVGSTVVSSLLAWRAETARNDAEGQKVIAQDALAEQEKATEAARVAEESANRQVYFTEITLAWDAYHEGNMAEARRLTDKHRGSPNTGIEWTLLDRELASIGEPWGNAGDILPTGLEVSANNDVLAVLGKDQVRVYDSTGNLQTSVQRFPRHSYSKTLCSLSSDGKFLAYQNEQGIFRVRNLETSAELPVPCDEMVPESISLSPTRPEAVIAIGDKQGEIRIVNWKSGDVMQKLTPSALQHDSRRVHPLTDPALKVSSGHEWLNNLRWSSDGTLVASAGGDGWLRVWNCESGELVHAWEHDRALQDVDFSPDGKSMATCHTLFPHDIYLWSLASGELQGRLLGHQGIVHAVRFLPEGRLTSSGRDNTIRIWDVKTQREQRAIRGHSQQVWSLAVARDPPYLYSASLDGEIRRWNLTAFSPSADLSARILTQVCDLDTTTDGQTLLSSQIYEHDVQVWDLVTGKLSKVLNFGTQVYPIAVSPNDVLAVGGQGVLYLHDLKTGQECEWRVDESRIRGLEYSHNGRFLAAANSDEPQNSPKHLIVWDVSKLSWDVTGKLSPVFTQRLDDPSLHFLKWSPDDEWLAGAGKRGVYVWNARTGDLVFAGGGHTQQVECIAWSPDGKTLASCAQDSSIRLLDFESKTSRALAQAHAGIVWEVAFADNGKTIISTSGDDTVGIWDVATGDLRARLPGHVDGAKSLLLTRDGKRLVTGGLWDGRIRVWKLK